MVQTRWNGCKLVFRCRRRMCPHLKAHGSTYCRRDKTTKIKHMIQAVQSPPYNLVVHVLPDYLKQNATNRNIDIYVNSHCKDWFSTSCNTKKEKMLTEDVRFSIRFPSVPGPFPLFWSTTAPPTSHPRPTQTFPGRQRRLDEFRLREPELGGGGATAGGVPGTMCCTVICLILYVWLIVLLFTLTLLFKIKLICFFVVLKIWLLIGPCIWTHLPHPP